MTNPMNGFFAESMKFFSDNNWLKIMCCKTTFTLPFKKLFVVKHPKMCVWS